MVAIDHSRLDRDGLRGLRVLRERIEAAGVPSSQLDETLNIATWNIRAFGLGDRTPAALHYIAEILNLFDLVAIVELNENLAHLRYVLDLLGPWWKVVYDDAIPDDAGNGERLGFVYDSRSVRFQGFAAEADPPRSRGPAPGGGGRVDYGAPFEWWRAPYMVSFRAGRFDFVLLSVHIRDGGTVRSRNVELDGLADWVHARRQNPYVVDRDLIVLGDFNITSRRSSTFKAMTRHGLQVAPGLMQRQFGSDLSRNKSKRYDQILHYPLNDALYLDHGGTYRAPAGLVDFFAGDHRPLVPFRNLSHDKFTFQMSDHLPLWMQLNVWSDDLVLDQLLAGHGG